MQLATLARAPILIRQHMHAHSLVSEANAQSLVQSHMSFKYVARRPLSPLQL